MAGKTIYSAPRITLLAKEFLKPAPDLREYNRAAEETVNQVVQAIKERIEKEISKKRSQKEIF